MQNPWQNPNHQPFHTRHSHSVDSGKNHPQSINHLQVLHLPKHTDPNILRLELRSATMPDPELSEEGELEPEEGECQVGFVGGSDPEEPDTGY